jgi:hypothetical protein
MPDFKRGIKAGVAVVAIYLLISVILEVTGFSDQFGDITMAAGLRFSPVLMDPSFVIVLILTYIIPYVIRGIIFGVVFAAVYNLLPGTKSVIKGVVLSIFLWIVAVIEGIYTTPGWPWGTGTNGLAFSGSATFYSGMISLSSVGMALAGILSAMVFGALTGFLWDRLRVKELAEERQSRPVLLVSFIFGVLMWALPAIGFIIGVGIGGLPIIEPGPGWWYGILAASVVFLGLPGWVLARAAWRRTKRGESGFKWGVAGGVLMALTGILLLPGALAITGGVLSHRESIIEPSSAAIEP